MYCVRVSVEGNGCTGYRLPIIDTSVEWTIWYLIDAEHLIIDTLSAHTHTYKFRSATQLRVYTFISRIRFIHFAILLPFGTASIANKRENELRHPR